jgi:hypothetical protein
MTGVSRKPRSAICSPSSAQIRGSLDLTERNHLFPPLSRRLLDTRRGRMADADGPQQTSGSIIRY